MKLGVVLGHVVSTVKTESHHGLKLLVVQAVDEKGQPYADPVISADCAQAGVGDLVLILEEGGAAREVMKRPGGAVDAVIVGVVDHLDSDEGFFNRGNIS
jgi:microcompartment protein CcmK/EutM